MYLPIITEELGVSLINNVLQIPIKTKVYTFTKQKTIYRYQNKFFEYSVQPLSPTCSARQLANKPFEASKFPLPPFSPAPPTPTHFLPSLPPTAPTLPTPSFFPQCLHHLLHNFNILYFMHLHRLLRLPQLLHFFHLFLLVSLFIFLFYPAPSPQL